MGLKLMLIKALIKQAKQLPEELYKSLTWDRGFELADHKRFTMAPTSQCTSAIRRVPGSVARTRTPTLVATVFPPRHRSIGSQHARLNQVVRELKERPRKTLGYASPAQRFQACVASIN
jgi:IS30 family transposase